MKQFFKLSLVIASMALLSACSTTEYASHLIKSSGGNANTAKEGNFKVGKPYDVFGTTYVPQETYSYSEKGVASWYGPGFHGNQTASGETYDKYDYTAAHRTLQMPSLVRVTNLDNGRSVIVRVNDRGPFAKGRIIDVSKRAAQQLDMIGTGTARVKVELLSDESRKIAEGARRGIKSKGVEIAMNETGRLPAIYNQFDLASIETASGIDAPRTSSNIIRGSDVSREQLSYDDLNVKPVQNVNADSINPITGNDMFVQVGAFGNQSNAQRLSQNLASIAPSRVDPVDYSGRTLYKVRLGPMKSVDEADRVLREVIQSGQSDAAIIVK
jgi:rare lipoprotein A